MLASKKGISGVAANFLEQRGLLARKNSFFSIVLNLLRSAAFGCTLFSSISFCRDHQILWGTVRHIDLSLYVLKVEGDSMYSVCTPAIYLSFARERVRTTMINMDVDAAYVECTADNTYVEIFLDD